MSQQNNPIRLTFAGGAGTVTGANFLLEYEGARLMVDCGMVQGLPDADARNRSDFEYSLADIDAVVITHAHMDHIGRLPKLVRDGYRGPIYSTDPTRDLAAIMLEDGARIVGAESKKLDLDAWYDQSDVDLTLSLWQTMPYHGMSVLGKKFSVRLLDAGHVLGSAMVEVSVGGKKVLFTGDLGNSPMPLLRDAEAAPLVDYIVMESVYGDREHEARDERLQKLERTIEDTVHTGGALIVPIFSLERTQEILFEINNLVEQKKIPAVPVFLDSPLAIRVTEIYRKHGNYFNKQAVQQAKSDDLFAFPGLKLTETKEESKTINEVPSPKIIMAGSGMSHAGRVIHHERRYLADPKSKILLVGYQGAGTFGRLLQSKPKKVTLFGDSVRVRASIETIKGYSGHKDLPALLAFVEPVVGSVRQVFCTMGETKSSRFLAQRLRDYYGVKAVVPVLGQTVILK